jgi:hypothetical protein
MELSTALIKTILPNLCTYSPKTQVSF